MTLVTACCSFSSRATKVVMIAQVLKPACVGKADMDGTGSMAGTEGKGDPWNAGLHQNYRVVLLR